jgi:3',5'-cyclic AMP phosphodiesterase CpdA
MKRLAWLTDAHLNFLGPDEAAAFVASMAESDADAFLIGGDLGDSRDLALHLNALHTALTPRPVYFVLGNHDFYGSSIASVRETVRRLCTACAGLHWLPASGVVPLTDATCLVGHGGWGDGRCGHYWGLRVRLNDWRFIDELVGLNDERRLEKLEALGDEAAGHFRSVLPEALARFAHVVVLTHVPPFREACWHEGRISDDDWLPHFTCKAVGDVLLAAMEARPDRRMTVLCGHTHGAGEAQMLPNLRVLTGGAEYGQPRVQGVIEVE